MVFKLLIVILTLVVINNNAQRFNHIDIDRYDLYKYDLIKDLRLKRDENKENQVRENHPSWKNTMDNVATPKPPKTEDLKLKRAWHQLDLMDMLRDPLIFVPDDYEFEDKLGK